MSTRPQPSCRNTFPSVMLLAAVVAVLVSSNMRAQSNGEPEGMSPMLQPWTGPYGGVPPWNLVRPDEFIQRL